MVKLFIKRTDEERRLILAICRSILEKHGVYFIDEEIMSRSRESYLVFVRSLISAYLTKRGFSLNDIAKILKRDSHASIINYLKYPEKEQARDGRWDSIVRAFTTDETKFELELKIKWHQREIIKLTNLKKELSKK